MGLGQIHKQEFKMKSTCTTKERGWLVQVECKWCNKLSRDNLKHKFYTAPTCGKRHHSLPLVDFVTLRMGYIQMTFFPKIGTPVVPKTLDVHIFLKSNLFGTCKGNIL